MRTREEIDLIARTEKVRSDTIEECARVSETNDFSLTVSGGSVGITIAAAIRALKDKP